jgi:hypothetical protein
LTAAVRLAELIDLACFNTSGVKQLKVKNGGSIVLLLLRDEEQLVVLAQETLHNRMLRILLKHEDVCWLVLQSFNLLDPVPCL